MPYGITRRQTVIGMSSLLSLPALGRGAPGESLPSGPFRHGVASGDPEARSVVLWTRLSGATAPQSVRWQVATDAGFGTIVAQGEAEAQPERDFTVKVVAGGLEPGAGYYY
ncbi:MAG: PhoD-like phosphatase N-terminal domain-containing protein, partial [Chromatocurvus sp.]